MRRTRIIIQFKLCLTVLPFIFTNVAYSQEFYRGLTKEECDARGGRITQWTNTAGTYPEVGTCLVTPASPSRSDSSSDRSESRPTTDSNPSCKLMYQSYDRLNHLPRTNGLADECKYFRSEIRILEETLRYFPCRGDSVANETMPDTIRESMQRSKEAAEEVCRMANTPAKPAIAPAPSTPSPPSSGGQPQSPGSATNCIAIREDRTYRQFILTNECTFAVHFRLQSTNFDGSRDVSNRTLYPRAQTSIISHREPPAVLEPVTLIERARGELAILQQMKGAIDQMPEGPDKEAQKARFAKMLSEFLERTKKLR